MQYTIISSTKKPECFMLHEKKEEKNKARQLVLVLWFFFLKMAIGYDLGSFVYDSI